MWIKDDGGCSSLYGGNKIRKLEYLLGGLQQAGRRRLALWGGENSHSFQAVAAAAPLFGFEVFIAAAPAPGCCGFTGISDRLEDAPRVKLFKAANLPAAAVMARVFSIRHNAVLLPLGLTTPLSCLGYAAAAIELRDQIGQGLLPMPAKIFVAAGSGGTAAGLLVGCLLAGLPSRIVAVQAVDSIIMNRLRLRRLVSSVAKLLGLPRAASDQALGRLERLERSELGGGYGLPTPRSLAAVDRAAAEGLVLEPLYTGKAFSALCSEPGSGEILFWNTHSIR